MNIIGRNAAENRKRVYWIVAAFVFILFIKFGSKYINFYMHEKECVAHYLKKNNFSHKINNVEAYDGSEDLCIHFVQQNIDKHREFRSESLTSTSFYNNQVGCIMKKYDNSSISLDGVYLMYLNLLDENMKDLADTEVEQQKKSKDIVLKMEKLKIDLFYFDCHMDDDLQKEFKKILDAAKYPEQNEAHDYCYAKYLNSKNLVYHDLQKYLHVPENSKYFCDENFILELKEMVEEIFNYKKGLAIFKYYPKFRECFMQKAEDLQLIDKMTITSVMGRFGLDEAEKYLEFTKFSKLIDDFKKGLSIDCLKNYQYS